MESCTFDTAVVSFVAVISYCQFYSALQSLISGHMAASSQSIGATRLDGL